jgi:hypothetical protein
VSGPSEAAVPERRETSYVSLPAVISAAEADYEDGVRCVVMPCCGFTFDAGHTDDRVNPPRYTCPQCRPPGGDRA